MRGGLIKFIQSRHPNIRLQGVDAARNLIAIASELCNSCFISGDYREVSPDQQYDLIVCDFGFDLARFAESSTHIPPRASASSSTALVAPMT
jgi:trans-aconitate methyltransferase